MDSENNGPDNFSISVTLSEATSDFPLEVIEVLSEQNNTEQCARILNTFYTLFIKKLEKDLADLKENVNKYSDMDIIAPFSNQACESIFARTKYNLDRSYSDFLLDSMAKVS